MAPKPGLSARLVQDYLQRSRVQYNIINIQLLGGMVKVPSNMFSYLIFGQYMNSIWIGAIPNKLSITKVKFVYLLVPGSAPKKQLSC